MIERENKQAALKARLLKLRDRLELYSCHGADAFRVASGCYNGWNKRDADGVAWVEQLDHAGLRFVDFADKLARIDHTGWYADAFQDSLYRGCVLQLPGKNGRARYLAAYADPYNKGSYRVDASRVFIGELRDRYGADDSELIDCARAADSLAEREAEDAREYDESWQRGNEWRECVQTIREARRELAALRREVRAAKILPGKHTARALLAQCSRLREESRDAFKRKEKLISEWFYSDATRGAFNDAAGAAIV